MCASISSSATRPGPSAMAGCRGRARRPEKKTPGRTECGPGICRLLRGGHPRIPEGLPTLGPPSIRAFPHRLGRRSPSRGRVSGGVCSGCSPPCQGRFRAGFTPASLRPRRVRSGGSGLGSAPVDPRVGSSHAWRPRLHVAPRPSGKGPRNRGVSFPAGFPHPRLSRWAPWCMVGSAPSAVTAAGAACSPPPSRIEVTA